MQFYDTTSAAVRNIGMSSSGETWYRGQRRSDWPLMPRILRYGHSGAYLNRVENEMFADFRSSVATYLPGSNISDSWDVLAAMQHHGVATRLLDWTADLEVALYFALNGAVPTCSDPATWPCVWVLNPYRLNSLFCGQHLIFDKADTTSFDYYQTTIELIRKKSSWPNNHPIGICPGYNNDRIRVQHGRFTFHGANPQSLDSQCSGTSTFYHLHKITISPNEVALMRKLGKVKYTRHMQIFPDLPGYVSFLNDRAKMV